MLHGLIRRLFPFSINLVHIILLVGRLLRCIWPGDKVREERGAGVRPRNRRPSLLLPLAAPTRPQSTGTVHHSPRAQVGVVNGAGFCI
jgi:hypothetical protein